MAKKSPGLYTRNGIWHIDKQIKGIGRIQKSTGTGNLEDAEKFLSHEIARLRNAAIYGEVISHTFAEAAAKYILEASHTSAGRDIQSLDILVPHIGDLDLRQIHDATLAQFIEARRAEGWKSGTVRRDIAVVRRITTLAARKWRDESGNTWIPEAPLLSLPDWNDSRKPYPLSWDEQRALLKHLPDHLVAASLYAVNTGLRTAAQTNLRWEWEVKVPEIDASVFVIPGEYIKGKHSDDFVVVHNKISAAVIESQRGIHPKFVFAYMATTGKNKGEMGPVTRFANSSWRKARERAGIKQFRWHDWRHTFARRLRSARVSAETRKVLLGHKNSDITTHYSATEIQELIDAVRLLENSKETTLLRAIK